MASSRRRGATRGNTAEQPVASLPSPPNLMRSPSDASQSVTLSQSLVDSGTVDKLSVELLPHPTYRVARVDVHMGQGLERIKFTYTDGTIWSAGSSGGKPGTPLVLLAGEFLTKVVHERLVSQRKAGAALVLTTNFGRRFAFDTAWHASRLASEETTVTAEAGHEIVALTIRRGLLHGTVQQPVPEEEAGAAAPSEWYATVLPGQGDEAVEIQKHSTWGSAQSAWAEVVGSGGNGPALLIDVLTRAVLRSRGSGKPLKTLREAAVAQGLAKDFDIERGADWLATLHMLGRLLMQDRAQTALFLLKTAIMCAGSWFSLKSNIQVGRVVQAVANPGVNATFIQGNWAAQTTCDWLLQDCDDSSASVRYSVVASFLIYAAVGRTVSVFHTLLSNYTTRSNVARMEVELFRRILSLDLAFFELHGQSEVKGLMEVQAVQRILDSLLPTLLQQCTKAMMAVWMLMHSAPLVALLSLLFMYGTRALFDIGEGVLRQHNKVVDKAHALRAQMRSETLARITTVKMLAKEGYHSDMFAAATEQYTAASTRQFFLQRLFTNAGGFVMQETFQAIVYVITISMVESGSVGGVDLVAFLAIIKAAASAINSVKQRVNTLSRSLPSVERFWAAQQLAPTLKNGTLRPSTIQGAFRLQDVEFAYPTRPDQATLRGLTLDIAPHKITAIVGDSGAGKSTITKLLMRLYDPVSGSVTLDGVDLKEWDSTYLRQQIAVVSQNPALMEASLGENIAYGAVGSTYDAAAVQAASDAAQCDEFISGMRGGFDTFAGDGGSQISGGQKQRIAIARALMRDPAILILDEATSALDAANERLVQAALETAMVGRTIVVVAHRLSTVRNADTILCMKDGMVVERGTHEELLAAQGAYAELVATQLGS